MENPKWDMVLFMQCCLCSSTYSPSLAFCLRYALHSSASPSFTLQHRRSVAEVLARRKVEGLTMPLSVAFRNQHPFLSTLEDRCHKFCPLLSFGEDGDFAERPSDVIPSLQWSTGESIVLEGCCEVALLRPQEPRSVTLEASVSQCEYQAPDKHPMAVFQIAKAPFCGTILLPLSTNSPIA